MAETPSEFEKIMSATLGDFQRGIKAIAPDHEIGADARRVSLQTDDYSVEIDFEAIEPIVHSPLLSIPRAKVTLAFDQTPAEARKKFMERFELAFQRGG